MHKSFEVLLSQEFCDEITGIYNYISEKLLASDTAKKQVERILEKVESLNIFPKRFSVAERIQRKNKVFRKMLVDNFIVFYYIEENKNKVFVVHVFYAGRDIDELF